ncbi:MAG TPA: cytochrome c biogenesis protein DipZ [Pseudonocardia sp.]|jgi:cytochrome c biogenesis protein CcdA/thiol-disulfide isomerase/thioredoxin|nr:cytochrome c biogenesis protein DipZ [Pseudonocardia sp.]
MILLVVVGLLAGVITSLSPCVLPVLPVVLAAGSRSDGARPDGVPSSGDASDSARPAGARRSWRPYGVVAGLVVSFTASTLFGSLVLSALHLPQDLLRDAGVLVLVLIGLGLLWPRLGELLERPFAALRGRPLDPDRNGVVLGLGLGLLFVPCAGPVLAAIAVVGASHRVGLDALLLTGAFGVGVGLPLLVLALAGDAIGRRTGVVRRHARGFRLTAGVVLIVVAAALGLNLTDGLQRAVPGYTAALQNLVEGNPGATDQLRRVAAGTGGPGAPSGLAAQAVAPDQSCADGVATPVNCGTAPELTGLTGWLNTPGNQPLSLASLRGKVVLIDFWTYSCINCQRTLPHLEAWYRAYHDAGLEIIGVHTPEFAFEHVPSNVAEQARALGVAYPVAIDNDYATWNAYNNQYWPAEYLVDPQGVIRHVAFGEGGYGTAEELIRQLLVERNPERQLPPATEVPDATPTGEQTQETYLGYHYSPLHLAGADLDRDRPAAYRFPTSLDPGNFALGGTWTAGAEALTAGPDARLRLSFHAAKVYLVLGGQGTVTVTRAGRQTAVIPVTGVPQLYPLVNDTGDSDSTLELAASPGVQAYDFTFG